MTFIPVSCDQICVQRPMWVRLMLRLLKRVKKLIFWARLWISTHSLMAWYSLATQALLRSPLPWVKTRTSKDSSQRFFQASQRGDSGSNIIPKKRMMAGMACNAHGMRNAAVPLMNW